VNVGAPSITGWKQTAPMAEHDPVLVWSALALLLIGLVMVYSSSIATAEASKYTGYQASYFLLRQGLFLAIGVAAGVVAYQVPLATWQRTAPYLFLFGAALLVLVLIPGLGREVNGARRWLPLGIVNLQPSELMKLFVVLYAADYTVRKAAQMASLRKGFAPMFFVMLATGCLLLLEPDFGAFAVITLIAMGILFLGGMNWRLFVGLIALLAVGFVVLIVTSPYRMQRIVAFMDPWADPYGKGYQLSHALIAFGRGEWLGVGLGSSVEKLFYLPEAHTDFLLAVIGEELGFAGVAVVIGLFAWLCLRAFAIGRRAADLERPFGALVAQGIAVWLGVQAFINMGVNLGVLPTKGLTLPFMSFGGSALVTSCVALAILLRVDWECRQLMRGQPG
jgi:cell division protein FtsW